MPRPLPRGIGLPQSPFSTRRSSTCWKSGRWASSSRRSATGSLPVACAISSMKLSMKNTFWEWPGARHGPERHMRVLEDRDDAEVRQLVARVDQALQSSAGRGRSARPGRVRAAGRIAHVERNRRSVGRKARLEADRGLGAVAALADFLLARPDQLHRLADRLGDRDRLGDFVRTAAAGRSRRRRTCCGCRRSPASRRRPARRMSAPGRRSGCRPRRRRDPPAHARWR